MADGHPLDMEIRRLVSPSIVDFQVRFMDGIGELMRQLGESLEVELIDRYSDMLDKQGGKCAPLGDQQPTGDGASSHVSGSRVAFPIGNGLMCMRAPQSPGLPESTTDSVDAGLRACVSKPPPLKSLQEPFDMSRVDKVAPRCEAGLLHTSCVREALPESALSQEPGFVDSVHSVASESGKGGNVDPPSQGGDTQNLCDESDIPTNLLGQAEHEPTDQSAPSSIALREPLLHRIVKSKWFDMVFSFFILLNCAFLGVEAHESVKLDMRPWMVKVLAVAEHVFTTLFSIEFFLRATVFGCASFSPFRKGNLLNFVDALIVIFPGIVFTWVVPICAVIIGLNSENETVRSLSVLRAIRLLRMVQVIRTLPMLREAFLLISGLTNSARTLFWACTVIAFVTYVFAIFGIVLIFHDLQDQYRDTVDGTTAHIELGELCLLFGGLDVFMYTLVQVLTGDSFHSITRVVLKYVGWSWVYFYSYIAVATFVLMNLITAIIVDNCLACSRQDEHQEISRLESQRKQELEELQTFFSWLDKDSSGTLSWKEFKRSFRDPEMTNKWLMLDFQPDECRELFTLLDDGDGEIETGEFFEGLRRLKGAASAKDVFRLQKSIDYLSSSLKSWRAELAAPRPPRGELRAKPLTDPT